MKALSLFSSLGIAEYYLKALNIDVVVANELNAKRAKAYSSLYKDCNMVNGDICDSEVLEKIIEKARQNKVKLIVATPPCQGFSLAGFNKTEESILKDQRNYLILKALEVVDAIMPDFFLIENVPRFQKMVFPYESEILSLEKLLKKKYSDKYAISVEVLNAADFGVPQIRSRVVYRMWKKNFEWNIQPKEKQITLKEAIGDLPSLEAGESSIIKNHWARPHPDNQILCMRNTKTGFSAFSNRIFFPVKKNGEKIKGYNNTYKRMRWDMPAPTITMRNEIISSQENVHPGRPLPDGTWSDARVLTLRELLIVSSLPAEMDIPKCLTETAFRQLIGEGIPPLMLKKILHGIKGE